MGDYQSDLDVIRAAWRLLPIHEGKSGSIIELRYARADVEGLRVVLTALERIDRREPLSQESVSEIWSLPYYMHRSFRRDSSKVS